MLAEKTTPMRVAIVSSFYFEQVIYLWVTEKVLNVEIEFSGIILGRSGIITMNFERKNIISRIQFERLM